MVRLSGIRGQGAIQQTPLDTCVGVKGATVCHQCSCGYRAPQQNLQQMKLEDLCRCTCVGRWKHMAEVCVRDTHSTYVYSVLDMYSICNKVHR